MSAASPFAEVPATPEPIIAQVRRQLADDAWPGLVSHEPVLDRVADRAVRELWGSRVKTFVPVLALRDAREMLLDQERWITSDLPEADQPEPKTAPPRTLAGVAGGDAMTVTQDVLAHDDRDVLHL